MMDAGLLQSSNGYLLLNIVLRIAGYVVREVAVQVNVCNPARPHPSQPSQRHPACRARTHARGQRAQSLTVLVLAHDLFVAVRVESRDYVHHDALQQRARAVVCARSRALRECKHEGGEQFAPHSLVAVHAATQCIMQHHGT
jgi:hypothetical protein